jgi:sterol desaturase/sphingolipid hydroxylase (fatty acid hydroxylase superfamily)
LKIEYISLIIICSWAVILTILERIFPLEKGQKIFRKGFWMDFFWYTLVQSFLLGVIIAFIIRMIDSSTDISRLKIIYDWPVFYQVLLFFITHDLWQYWFHRLQHTNKYFWRTHEAAHATPEVDWLVGSRSHSIEILIAQTIEFAPIVLLGAKPEIAIIKATMDSIWGMYNHSNLKINHSFLIYIFNGPQLHRWHHSKALKPAVNFSTKLSLWDWIWGAAYNPFPEMPEKYGLEDESYPNYSYFKHLILAFRPWSN